MEGNARMTLLAWARSIDKTQPDLERVLTDEGVSEAEMKTILVACLFYAKKLIARAETEHPEQLLAAKYVFDLKEMLCRMAVNSDDE